MGERRGESQDEGTSSVEEQGDTPEAIAGPLARGLNG